MILRIVPVDGEFVVIDDVELVDVVVIVVEDAVVPKLH